MDQRRELRFVADQSVVVTVLGEPEWQLSARIRNVSGRGLAMEAPRPVPPGSALKIEIEDAIVLGETVYCKENGSGCLIGVQLDQMLCGLLELRRRLQEFAPEEGPRAPAASCSPTA